VYRIDISFLHTAAATCLQAHSCKCSNLSTQPTEVCKTVVACCVLKRLTSRNVFTIQ